MPSLSTWVSIPTADIERAVAFYNTLLSTRLEILDCGEERMACLDDGVGCLYQSPEARPSASGTQVSLSVADLDAALKTVGTIGGEILRPKAKIEAEDRGYCALVRDCEGNAIGLHSL